MSAIITALSSVGLAVTAGEQAPARYTLEGCVLEVDPPVEVGRAPGHFWFSYLHVIQGQDILCEVVLSDDKAQGKWPAALCLSRDGGKSWSRVRDIDSYGPVSTPLAAGRILFMPYETWPISPADKRNAVADGTIVTLADDGSLTAQPTPVKYLSFPQDLADYHVGEVYLFVNGNILSLKDRRLFATVYGKFAGDTKDSVWSVTSADHGFTWQFQSVVASGKDLTNLTEGANESHTARLADGRLLTVYRTGSDYHKSYSSDEGETWSAPEPMPGVFRVEPQLVRLENGVLLLSGGRQGLYLWACTDGEGKKWEQFNLAEHHNRQVPDEAHRYTADFCEGKNVDPPQSTSYTGMKAVGPNEVLISYDHLANGWKGAPGPWGPHDMVFCVRVKATLRPPEKSIP
ncbi:MAG: exo-alpha-sialidase [Candidatus Hydrogenedentes bacterium]|nr:exo-alpha-sialidase [Candidatus Hydrogenedentota bacterium]